MKLHVLKFGGSSLKDEHSIQQAVYKVMEHLCQYERLVVVVSAMGRFPSPYATDTFRSFATHLSKKQKDRLMSYGELISSLVFENACRKMNIQATALTLEETGILTDDSYGHGRVLSVNASKMKELLHEAEVLIVPGFAGKSITGNVVTLSRGGSDYSAFLVADALGVPFVSIYTNVDGVFDKDPLLYEDAQIYERLSYEEMLELIDQGAKVMQKESVLFAKKQKIAFEVKNTFTHEKGTLIGK